jgi:hypothetical protein
MQNMDMQEIAPGGVGANEGCGPNSRTWRSRPRHLKECSRGEMNVSPWLLIFA